MGEITRFLNWLKRVRKKYLSNRNEAIEGVRALEEIIDTIDVLIPDRIDGKVMAKARDFVDKLKMAAVALPMD